MYDLKENIKKRFISVVLLKTNYHDACVCMIQFVRKNVQGWFKINLMMQKFSANIYIKGINFGDEKNYKKFREFSFHE